MKKYLIIGLIVIGMLLPTIEASIISNEKSISPPSTSAADFTHAVFAEYATTTGCGYCPKASADLYEIYQSQDYPFYYVSLVADKNEVANNRCYHYRAYAVPSVYFDGGAKNVTGAVGEASYRNLITQCGQRTVHSLEVTITATDAGNGRIKITVTVKNNGLSFYIGGILTYVTEIVSRWHDAQGKPYHYACLDLPMKKPLFLFPKGQRKITTTWDSSAKGFSDIDLDNIQIISSVCHWKPHTEVGYGDKQFTAFYVDQTAGAPIST